MIVKQTKETLTGNYNSKKKKIKIKIYYNKII